ncbi:hypothetical protein V1463_10550 [Micrococcus yunnanensis]|uniref:hypothetical protein n=1 Tax=Actinomycetes TaxID=1760 RepID=UPI001129436E
MSELSMVVDRLTMTTPQMVRTSAGPVVVRVAPLLEVLQGMVHHRTAGAGGRSSSSSGSGAPLDMEALNLMVSVEEELVHLQWVMRSAHPPARAEMQAAADLFRVPFAVVAGPPAPGFGGMTVFERLRWTAVRAAALGRDAEVLAVVRGWVSAIERRMDPPVVIQPRKPCPACGEHMAWTMDPSLDELVQVPAISVVVGDRPRGWCIECGAEWVGPEVVDLVTQCGGSTELARNLLGR